MPSWSCVLYTSSSGTYEFYKESVLKNKNYMSSSLSMPATGAIIQSVSQTRGDVYKRQAVDSPESNQQYGNHLQPHLAGEKGAQHVPQNNGLLPVSYTHLSG